MGSGDRAYRTLKGEGLAIQEHQLAMIPIMKQQTEMEMELGLKQAEMGMELGLKQAEISLEFREKTFAQELEQREKAFGQELEQTEKMNLLTVQLQPEPILPEPILPEPILLPAGVTETKPVTSKYLLYAGLAALAYFLLR